MATAKAGRRYLAYLQTPAYATVSYRRTAPWPEGMKEIDAVRRHIKSRYRLAVRKTLVVTAHPWQRESGRRSAWTVTVDGPGVPSHGFHIAILGPA